MEFIKKKRSESAMDLMQILDKGEERSGRNTLFEVLLSIGLSVGCWYTYFSMFPNPMDNIVSMLLIVLLPVAMYLFCRVEFIGRFLAFYIFILTAFFYVLFYEHVWNGFLVMANIVVEVLNNHMDAGLVPFEIAGDVAQWSVDSLMAMASVIVLVSVAIAYSVYYKAPLLGFVITAIPVIIGLCLKAQPFIWLLILLIVCWAGLFALSMVLRPVSNKKRRMIYIQNGKRSSVPYIFLSVCLVILLGYTIVFSVDAYKPVNGVDDAKNSVIDAEEHLRYDKLNGDDIDSLSNGDLTRAHSLEYTDNEVLKLKMQMAQSMYLRKFSGGDFENGKWKESAEGAYSGEYTGAMEWLAQQGFYPWMQQDRLYRMSDNYDFISVDVINTNASSKYIYLPYEAVLTGDTMPGKVDYKKDYGAYSNGLTGQREYSFKVFKTRLDDYDEKGMAAWLAELKNNEGWNEYSETEAVYRRFVYDTYLYISPDDYETMKAVGAEDCLGKTISYTLNHIRKVFDDDFNYSLEKSAAGSRKDQLKDFIDKSHTGNDMHFATAAALMFRCAGIPARYAEGYYISPEMASDYEGESDVTLNILDSYAHSWVEIYIDEIGWFPVEVVPGYYDMEKEQSEEHEEIEKPQEQPKMYYQNETPEYDQPDKSGENDDRKFNPLWLLPLLILALIGAFEYLGRRRIKKLLESFENVFTEQKVYEMYKYVSRLMAFDKHPVSVDPYDGMDEILSAYDGTTGLGFEAFVRMVNAVRFGGVTLTETEHKEMAVYAVTIGEQIYLKQNRFKRFVMKFILFFV